MPCTGELSYDETEKDVSNNVVSKKNNYSDYSDNGDYKFDTKNIFSPTTPEEKNILTAIPSNNSNSQITPQNESICRFRTPSTRSLLNPSISFNSLHPLPGEEFESENWVDLCHCRLLLTQFRIIIVTHNHNAACAIPLLNVESIAAKDIVGLHILCKDGRIIRVQAGNSETAITWYKKLVQVTCVTRKLEDFFTFKFHKTIFKQKLMSWIRKDVEKRHYSSLEALAREYKHLDLKEISWKVTTVNENFELCATYPQYLIVPSSVSNEELLNMGQARFYNRFPTLVWRSKRTGALLYRSSQPTVGFFGMSNEYDVKLYEKMKSITNSEKQSKFLIMDARSYTAAWANRAKGGGFETSDAYKDAEVIFMGLPNIHNIRYSFHQLRLLLNSSNDQNTYLQTLQSTNWLQNIGCLFSATERCLNALCYDGISVLVHCSDGWDRTTQIVSLSMLIADSYYRTFEGFEMLVQRQWIEFGHKFADRSGVLNGDENERSPVFLQFLDCVYQLWMKNPDAFEFNRRYLMKLVQHTYSGLFSSFLFNNIKDSIKAGCTQHVKAVESHRISISSIDIKANGGINSSDENKQLRAFSIWDYLGKHNYEFINPAYNVKYAHQKTMLIFPKLMSEFELWRDAYCCTPAQTCINNPESASQSSTATTPNANSSALNNTSSSVSSHEGALEKAASTLSRSQSASSLTSLEQNTSGIQPLHISSHHNASVTSHPVGSISSTTSNLSNYMTRMSNDNSSIYGWQSQNYLDVDGLSKVPIVFEDRVVEMHREFLQLELQTNNNKRMGNSEIVYHRDINGGRYPSTPNGDQHQNGTTTITNTTMSLLTNTGSNSFINNGFNTNNVGSLLSTNFTLNTSTATTTRRVRNESIDSTSLGFEFIDDFDPCLIKRKHDSSGNSSSCSTFTILNECNGGCKNMMRARMSSLNSDKTNGNSAEDKTTTLYGSVEEVRSQCHSNGGGQLVVG